MRRAAIRCTICGGRCACRKSVGGICCPCHRHKGRRLLPGVALWDKETVTPAERAEIEAIEAERARDARQLPLLTLPAHTTAARLHDVSGG